MGTKFYEWEDWTGEGDPPSGPVQPKLRKDNGVDIGRDVVSAFSLRWDHLGDQSDVTEYRRVKVD